MVIVFSDGVVISKEEKEDMDRLPTTNSVIIAQLFNSNEPSLFVNESSPTSTRFSFGSPTNLNAFTFLNAFDPT